MPTINRLELCFVRTRALPTMLVLGDGNPGLSREHGYAAVWGISDVWAKPWQLDRSYSYYWKRLLRVNYEVASAHRAFARLVPLMKPKRTPVECSGQGVTGEVCDLVSPLGVAVELRLTLDNETGDIAVMLSRLNNVINGSRFETDGLEAPLRRFLEERLDGLERSVTGRIDEAAESDDDVASVLVCTDVEGWPSGTPVEGDEVHQLLDALVRFKSKTKGSAVSLNDAILAPSKRFGDTTRLMAGSACVIWCPERAVATESWNLVCYQRNVAMALLQAEIATNAMSWAAEQSVMSPEVRMPIHRASVALSASYGKSSDFYASEFVKRFITERFRAINEVRRNLGIGPPLAEAS